MIVRLSMCLSLLNTKKKWISHETAHTMCNDASLDLETAFSACFNFHMSLVVRKPVFGVSDQVRHKPGCTTTQDG